MIPIDAMTIVLRYLISLGAGWLVGHGILAVQFSDEVTTAIAQIVIAILAFLGALAWALWKNTIKVRLQSILKRDDVSTVVVSPQLAADVKVDGVVPQK